MQSHGKVLKCNGIYLVPDIFKKSYFTQLQRLAAGTLMIWSQNVQILLGFLWQRPGWTGLQVTIKKVKKKLQKNVDLGL